MQTEAQLVNIQLFIHRLGLNIINLSTKYEVSTFIHYEDMKGNAKCRNWGGFGRWEVLQSLAT